MEAKNGGATFVDIVRESIESFGKKPDAVLAIIYRQMHAKHGSDIIGLSGEENAYIRRAKQSLRTQTWELELSNIDDQLERDKHTSTLSPKKRARMESKKDRLAELFANKQ